MGKHIGSRPHATADRHPSSTPGPTLYLPGVARLTADLLTQEIRRYTPGTDPHVDI